MIEVLLALVAYTTGWYVALPALSDLLLWFRGTGRAPALPTGAVPLPRLLFLVPAHNEELLIERTVRSLLAQDYPREALSVAVIADNCVDRTAALARFAGATVLERTHAVLLGKHHSIEWALQELPWRESDAVVVIDADTVVEPDYAMRIGQWPGLAGRVLQTYDHLSNEYENALTRLAGLFARTRYEIALPLKARAGLSVPMTGDGIVLGREVLMHRPWRIETITEGWELYARFTVAGIRVDYEPRARLYAEEAKTLIQSGTQRERWTAGRLHVLRLYWRRILTQAGIRPLQRIDLLAELMSIGPVPRSVLAAAGAGACLLAGTDLLRPVFWLFLTGLLQPAIYSLLVLRRHPEPWPTVRALAFLPRYGLWRSWLLVRSAMRSGARRWVRTRRGNESPGARDP